MKQKVPVLAFVLICLVFFSASTLANNDTLVISSLGEAPGLDPRMETDVYSFERVNVIMEPLVVFNFDMELEPRLANSWAFSDDNMTITFNLRDDVIWHDGEPFTAQDVKYTYRWILDPDSQAPNRGLYTDIERMEIEDDYTIHFHLTQSNVFLINNIARMNIVPEHAGERSDFRVNPIGTGPYSFSNWVRDERMELVAFDDYWGGQPIIPNVVFRPIPENSTRLLAFEAGEVDVFRGGIVSQEIPRLEENPDFILHRTHDVGYNYMGMNTLVEPLDNVTFRRALAHLINREGIVERIYNGVGYPGVSPVPAALPWYNDDVRRYDYDLERSRELLEEAGYPDGGDVSLRLFVWEAPDMVRIAEIIQFEASRVGVSIVVNVEEWGAFLSRITGSDDYDLYLLGWSGQLDPDRAMFRQFHTDGSFNDVNISNERLDYLLEKGLTVPPDSQESIDIYREAQEIVLDLCVYAFINYREELALSHSYIDGMQAHPYNANTWINIHQFTKNK